MRARRAARRTRNRWGVDESRVVGIVGDLSQHRLGVSDADLERLKGKIDHLFHLAAIYDMKADAESQRIANVEGTRHMVQLAEATEAGRIHMVSSIASAGLYKGTWREDMFDEARTSTSTPTSGPSTSPSASSARSRSDRGASTARGSSSATRRPARWTRSTVPTTSSS